MNGRRLARLGLQATLFITLLLAVRPTLVLAEREADVAPDHRPQLCIDFHGEEEYALTERECPPHHAIINPHNETPRRYFPPSHSSIEARCCPLPATDILTDIHVWSSTTCPDGFLATSGTPVYCDLPFCKGDDLGSVTYQICRDCEKKLRCTKINSRRYRLGPLTGGAYAGISANRWKEKRILIPKALPAALVFAATARHPHSRSYSMCIGWPLGSLLVGKGGKRCSDQRFRQLEYTGAPGDPPAGTPVKIFPDCDYIDQPVDGPPRCKRFYWTDEERGS